MEALTLVVGMIIGVVVGSILRGKRLASDVMGRLRVDRSELDEPTRMFVELKGVTPDMIAQHQFVTFEVINESYISHN